MTNRQYDTVIIGAGASGLTVAAVLAAKENQKVLVVEKERKIGGRLASFVGEKDAISYFDERIDAKAYQNILKAVNTWVVRSNPALISLIEKGYLNGYTFEAGVHATFWGDRGRLAYVLDYLGKSIDIPGNVGFAVMDPEKNRWYQIEGSQSYSWMAEDARQETSMILKEMATLSIKDSEKYDLISFGEWLRERTSNRRVYEFIAALASIHMVMGEPDRMPAGDF